MVTSRFFWQFSTIFPDLGWNDAKSSDDHPDKFLESYVDSVYANFQKAYSKTKVGVTNFMTSSDPDEMVRAWSSRRGRGRSNAGTIWEKWLTYRYSWCELWFSSDRAHLIVWPFKFVFWAVQFRDTPIPSTIRSPQVVTSASAFSEIELWTRLISKIGRGLGHNNFVSDPVTD